MLSRSLRVLRYFLYAQPLYWSKSNCLLTRYLWTLSQCWHALCLYGLSCLIHWERAFQDIIPMFSPEQRKWSHWLHIISVSCQLCLPAFSFQIYSHVCHALWITMTVCLVCLYNIGPCVGTTLWCLKTWVDSAFVLWDVWGLCLECLERMFKHSLNYGPYFEGGFCVPKSRPGNLNLAKTILCAYTVYSRQNM